MPRPVIADTCAINSVTNISSC